jgi:hypothetical protein
MMFTGHGHGGGHGLRAHETLHRSIALIRAFLPPLLLGIVFSGTHFPGEAFLQGSFEGCEASDAVRAARFVRSTGRQR